MIDESLLVSTINEPDPDRNVTLYWKHDDQFLLAWGKWIKERKKWVAYHHGRFEDVETQPDFWSYEYPHDFLSIKKEI